MLKPLKPVFCNCRERWKYFVCDWWQNENWKWVGFFYSSYSYHCNINLFLTYKSSTGGVVLMGILTENKMLSEM